MKYANIIACIVTAVGGAVAGYYYGKKKTTAEYEADITSVKEEYQKKLQEAKSAGRMEAIKALEDGPDGEPQKLAANGDIDDEWVVVVKEEEADSHMTEDIVYFGADNVWYNQDKDRTYTNHEPFEVPKDLFSYFGKDRADLIYLHNTNTDTWYAVRYNPGSYVHNVLGYDDASEISSSSGGEEK